MRVPMALLSLALLAGCLGAETPLAAQSVAALPSEEAAPSGRLAFRDVRWEPDPARSGETVTLSADVFAVDRRATYHCLAVATRDASGEPAIPIPGLLSRGPEGRWTCALPRADADAIAVVLAGFDGERWVRSDYLWIDLEEGPGDGRPAPDVASLALAPVEGGARAEVEVRDAIAQSLFLDASVLVHAWVLSADGRTVLPASALAEEPEKGRYAADLASAAPAEDAVWIAFAEATNSLHGFARSGFAELGVGSCANDPCLTT